MLEDHLIVMTVSDFVSSVSYGIYVRCTSLIYGSVLRCSLLIVGGLIYTQIKQGMPFMKPVMYIYLIIVYDCVYHMIYYCI